ncbi:MAG: ATP synthase F1 subunit gamma [Clostridiales bacterium]|nr:ATP synthase F1 subunit gamma [Clostridiales bacterium]
MASVNEIRQHIAAVKQTRKITGAMELVSSTRMRRVMSHIEYNRQYFSYIRSTMQRILASSEDVSHPYLAGRPERRRTYVVISGDKGMCGAHNANVLELADRKLALHPGSSLITMGNTAEMHFRRKGTIPDITMFGIVQDPTLHSAIRVSSEIMHLFDKELTDEIHVIFTSFYGASKGKTTEFRLLPVKFHDYDDVADPRYHDEMLYHPSRKIVFDQLVPQYIIGLIFGMMVQAYASEHFARMNAMLASTQNAGEMLKTLTTQYNMARQSAITNELSEMTGAAEVLRGEQ